MHKFDFRNNPEFSLSGTMDDVRDLCEVEQGDCFAFYLNNRYQLVVPNEISLEGVNVTSGYPREGSILDNCLLSLFLQSVLNLYFWCAVFHLKM